MSDDEERQDIERYLHRIVDPSERHSVASLDQLSASQIDELRALRQRTNTIPPIRYLRFLVAGATMSEVQSFVEKVVERGATGAAISLPRVYVVEMRAFNGETTTTWARFVLLSDGTIRIVGKTDNDIRVADEMTARGVPGAQGAIVRRDRGIEFLRLLAENFRGSIEFATPVFEMEEDAALVM
jgi:hypothetical protein